MYIRTPSELLAVCAEWVCEWVCEWAVAIAVRPPTTGTYQLGLRGSHTASSSLGVRIYMASSSSVCAEWGHREHQWATATALSKCIVCAARTALPSQPPTRRLRRACDSGTTYIGTPSEPLGAVAQPLPGPVSSARLRSPPSFACVRHRNNPAPEPVRRHRISHASFCRVLATATAYPKRAHVPVPLTWLSTPVWL